jgi:cell division protein FtsW (lipid II flippase)
VTGARHHIVSEPPKTAGPQRRFGAGMEPLVRKVHLWTAAGVFAVMGTVFLLTAAPTVTFWDAGEFLTASAIMGIPHPPGAPLLTLAGRVMFLVPFPDFRSASAGSAAYRINLIAVLSGACAALLIYLIAVRLIRSLAPFEGALGRDWIVLFGAALAALAAGFSHQFWDNSVEIETYMPSLALSLLAVWLALRWGERRTEPGAVRYLFLAAFAVGIGNGIHLTVLLVAPVLFFLVATAHPAFRSDLRLWAEMIAAVLLLAAVRSVGGREIYMVLTLLLAAAGPAAAAALYREAATARRKALVCGLLCLSIFCVGYTVSPTIMIRASKHPAVNEGDPDTMKRYAAYLDREQYGQGTTAEMFRGMFDRTAGPGYQFGFMYLRYLLQQFPKWGLSPVVDFADDRSADRPGEPVRVRETAAVPLALWLLVLIGAAAQARGDIRGFLALFLYGLLTSVGLVLYLNMANPQARERDYFFLGSYQIAMIWLGIGAFTALRTVRTLLDTRVRRLATAVTAACALILATVVPAAAFSDHLERRVSNWRMHDRSDFHIARDGAVNLLRTCGADAILFTNGDNDTYPLWYVQEVEGVRRDIRVVNMSLLNAPWYIRQLRDENGRVPITFTDEYIDSRLSGETLESRRSLLWDPEPREVTLAGITWKMPPNAVGTLPDGRRVGMLTVASVMTAHIIDTVDWKRPIYFAVTVDPEFMIGLYEHMSTEGQAFRLVKERAPDGEYLIDAPALERNLFHVYSYRGIADPKVYKSPDTRRILSNYFVAFARLAEQYLKDGRREDAVRAARAGVDRCDPDPEVRMLLYGILHRYGLMEELNRMVDGEIGRSHAGEPETSVGEAMRFLENSMPDVSIRLLAPLRERYRANPDLQRVYIASLTTAGRYKEALDAADLFLALAHGDTEALGLRGIAERRMKDAGARDTVTVGEPR